MRPALALLFVGLLVACGATRERVSSRDAGSLVCTPSCEGRECGDDGCGGACGACPMAAPACVRGLCSGACVPDCTDRECGDDGCGNSCGTCPMAAPMCIDNMCRTNCTANCTNRMCGDDGCGGSCGTCATGDTCTTAGTCMGPQGCMPQERRCIDSTSYERCGFEAASSTTRTFGPRIACGDGTTCSSGNCRGACVRPEILLLVDRSQSMIGAEWIYVRQAIDDFVHAQEISMALGLRMFPSGPGCTAGAIHAPAYDNADFITLNLDTPTGDDQTPIAAAMSGLVGSFGASNDGQVVVLLTDGEETCAADATLASREAEVLLRAGIITYVVSIGAPSNAAFLDSIAAAGGTMRHRQVTDGGEVANVFANILMDLNACGRPAGSSVVGDACTAAMECGGGVCLTDFGRPFPDGYCSADCTVMACPTGSSCVPDAFNSVEVCLKNCTSGMDCRPGYDCYTYIDADVCFPNL